MGCLYELPGQNAVAQQSRWHAAPSAHFFLDGWSAASMVA